MPGEYPRDNISENLRTQKRPEIAPREERVLGGHLRYWKTASARTAPRRIYGRKSGRKLLREKKGYWEGACGTGKQQVPGQHPGEFTDAKAAGNCSARKKGTGRALAVLE